MKIVKNELCWRYCPLYLECFYLPNCWDFLVFWAVLILQSGYATTEPFFGYPLPNLIDRKLLSNPAETVTGIRSPLRNETSEFILPLMMKIKSKNTKKNDSSTKPCIFSTKFLFQNKDFLIFETEKKDKNGTGGKNECRRDEWRGDWISNLDNSLPLLCL